MPDRNRGDKAAQRARNRNRKAEERFYEASARLGRSQPRPQPMQLRHWLACIDCEGTIPLHRPEPRIPLCDGCKDKREQAKQRATRAKMTAYL